MTDVQTGNNLELVISKEPRLQAMGNKTLQTFIASQMFTLGLTFEQAESSVLGLIQSADTYKQEVKTAIESKRTEAEKTVVDTLRDAIMATMDTLTTKPQYGIAIFYDPNYEFKNADGSPAMDANNNPKRGPFVDFKFQWDNKLRGTGGTRTVSNTANMGRPEGDYIIEGESEVYKSMAAFAKAKWPQEFEKYQGTSRAFLTDKGYTVPTEPTEDSEGKKHWNITLTATNGKAA